MKNDASGQTDRGSRPSSPGDGRPIESRRASGEPVRSTRDDVGQVPSSADSSRRGSLPEEIRRKLVDNLPAIDASHRRHPEVDVDLHLLGLRLRTGDVVRRKTKIYLDQRYWIHCRDAAYGHPALPIHQEIWEGLCELVDRGIAICPLQYDIFSETLKMDARRRLKTASIIDRLSQNITLIESIARTRIELTAFAWRHLLPDTGHRVAHPREHVWQPTGLSFGFKYPVLPEASDELNWRMGKSFSDSLARLGMRDIMTIAGTKIPRRCEDDAARRTDNFLCSMYREAHSNFRSIFQVEASGISDMLADDLLEFGTKLEAKGLRIDLDKPSSGPADTADNLVSLIVAGIRLGRITTEVPSIHIPASLHAAFRHKRVRKKPGDQDDFRHARAALAYCDAFFTERRLANHLRTHPLRLDQDYDCIVLHREDEVAAYVQNLRASGGD